MHAQHFKILFYQVEPCGIWHEKPWQGMMLPVCRAGQEATELPVGILLVGANPRRAIDENYR